MPRVSMTCCKEPAEEERIFQVTLVTCNARDFEKLSRNKTDAPIYLGMRRRANPRMDGDIICQLLWRVMHEVDRIVREAKHG